VKQPIWSSPISRSGSVSISDALPVTTGNQLTETSALSPDGEWIAFDSGLLGKYDIYKMRLDGGPQHMVSDLPGNQQSPAWSPDGTEIAFHSSTAGVEALDVFVVSADGGTPEQLSNFPGQDVYPFWSPDGLAIAFNSQKGVPFSLWMVSRDSVGMPWGDPVQLTDFACGAFNVLWAPDGGSLMCRWGDELVRVSRDGEVLARLAKPAGMASAYYANFSPDGSRIYFHGRHDDGTKGRWWMPANGGDATNVFTFDDPSRVNQGFAVGSENVYFPINESESDIWVMDLEW